MSRRESTRSHRVLRRGRGASEEGSLDLIVEEPLSIRVDDRPHVVVMRTPGDEVFHAAGFCLGEGVVDAPTDVESIGYDGDTDPNIIDVWLAPGRAERVRDVLDTQRLVSQTSCGICGKQMLEDLEKSVTPAPDGFEMDAGSVYDCLHALSEQQKHYVTTRGAHAALILDDRLEPVSFAEDVGRHNALDKAVGKAFLDGTLEGARVLVLSSRNSYELVQKAARAHLPVVISHSRPTSLAVEMARALNMTLVFPAGESGLVVACGEDRIKGA